MTSEWKENERRQKNLTVMLQFFFDEGTDRSQELMRECVSIRASFAKEELLCAKFFLWSFPELRDDALLEECKHMWITTGKELIVAVIRKVIF